MRPPFPCLLALLTAFAPTAGLADFPVVEDAKLSGNRLSVTLSHPDSGWDHYADGWEVLTADGTRLGLRELAHPHVDEQPFTRALGGLVIPEGTKTLLIRARCNTDGWSDQVYELSLE